MRTALFSVAMATFLVVHAYGAKSYNATVERVVDGDTLVCLVDLGEDVFKRVYVRLWRVSAAERKTPEGEEARVGMGDIVPRGTPVRLDVKGRSHGRIVAIVWAGNCNINEKAVKLGICRNTTEKEND